MSYNSVVLRTGKRFCGDTFEWWGERENFWPFIITHAFTTCRYLDFLGNKFWESMKDAPMVSRLSISFRKMAALFILVIRRHEFGIWNLLEEIPMEMISILKRAKLFRCLGSSKRVVWNAKSTQKSELKKRTHQLELWIALLPRKGAKAAQSGLKWIQKRTES